MILTSTAFYGESTVEAIPLAEFSCQMLPSMLQNNHALSWHNHCLKLNVLLLTTCNHIFQVKTLTSYDMQDSLILTDNVPCEINQ